MVKASAKAILAEEHSSSKASTGASDLQVGVVSFDSAQGCADTDFPDVYARVFNAYEWIQTEACATGARIHPRPGLIAAPCLPTHRSPRLPQPANRFRLHRIRFLGRQ